MWYKTKSYLLIGTSALAILSASPSDAEPISISAALSTASMGAAATTFTIGSFTLTGFSAIAANFAVRAALGYALNALTTRGTTLSRGYSTTVNQLGPALPHQVIYGETRVGGAVFYQTVTTTNSADDSLHRCIAFAGHEIDSYQAIYLNGEEVTLDGSGFVTAPSQFSGSKVRIKQYLGTDTQTADSDLVSEVTEWTTNHRALGVAYLYVKFIDSSNFPNGIPTVSATIRGKKVEDTRTSTTAWSDNPALCIRDYLLSDYGLSEEDTNIDDTLFEAAADACEVQIAGADTYTCNGSFTLDTSPEEAIRGLLSSMGGIFWNYSGKWAIQAAEYQTPTVTLTEDDLRGPLNVATRHSRRDNFNKVVGQYKGPETNYQVDNFTEITGSIYVVEDNNIPASTELNLLFTDMDIMAQRIAKTFLRRNRKQISVTGAFGLNAMSLRIGDNVMLSIDHMGWTQKVFEVVDWRLGIQDGDIQVNMILREMSEEVFTGVVAILTDESGNVLQDESGNDLEAIVA